MRIFQTCFLNPSRPLRIGDDTGLGGRSSIFTHGSWQSILDGYPVAFEPVTIGKNVWLPWHVFILPGVELGDNATIGAGSVVNRSIPAGALAAGVPAKVLKSPEEWPRPIEEEDRWRLARAIVEQFGAYLRDRGVEAVLTEDEHRVAIRFERDCRNRSIELVRAGDGATGGDIVLQLNGRRSGVGAGLRWASGSRAASRTRRDRDRSVPVPVRLKVRSLRRAVTSAQDLVGESLRRLLRPLDDSLVPAGGRAGGAGVVAPDRVLAALTAVGRTLGAPVERLLSPEAARTAAASARPARVLIRCQGLPEFPPWPFDGSIVELLERYAASLVTAAGGPVEFRWFWPRGHAAAAILTHDVESAAGLRLALDLTEVERGFRSSFNVVADWYPLDDGILEELRGRGFEIGVRHPPRPLDVRVALGLRGHAAAGARGRGGVPCGRRFRSPATHRVVAWLAELPLE